MITPLPPHPALLVTEKKTKTLVIADLHIGWEIALSQKGMHVPTQTSKLLRKLKSIIAKMNPDRLLILGDIKHTVARAEMGEWQDIPKFFNELKKLVSKICIIRGNHDGNLEPLLPEGIEILPATGVTIGKAGLFHGHRWPSPTLLTCNTLAMGHLHPVVALRDAVGFRMTRQIWVQADCKRMKLASLLIQKHKARTGRKSLETIRKNHKTRPQTLKLLVVPSFNDLLGGKPLNKRKPTEKTKPERIMGPILRSDTVDMENADIYLLDGTYLGALNKLRIFS